MSSDSLAEAAGCLNEALHLHRTSTTAWETANSFFQASDSHLPHLNQVSDPGIRLHSSQPLPDTFVSQYRSVQFKSFMGLFPQINRAWLTVDSNLFLWGYTPFRQVATQNDFYVFEGINQVIVSVALVTPRPGVFVDSISYLLAVATPVEVTLLGVSFSPTGQLSLIPTQISIATDNTIMLKIVSSRDGRIFMAGSDGHLHEFVYGPQHSSSLLNIFSGRAHKRARKVSHSSSSFASYFLPASVRSYMAPNKELIDLAVEENTLFTLSQAGVLAVYDITTSVTLVATSHIAADAKHLVSYSIPASDREFVSIHPVPMPFSASVQLIVATSFAERIYYTTRPSSSYSNSRSPTTLKCVGYRPSPEANMSRGSQPFVHIAWCHHGAAVFADLKENESDKLICIYPDSTLASSQLNTQTESRAAPLNSVEIVIGTELNSVPSHLDPQLTYSSTRGQGDTFNGTNAASSVARTFAIADAEFDDMSTSDGTTPLETPAFFWVLTSTAMLLFERVQPVDKLSSLLSSAGDNTAEVTRFFDRYGSGDSCAMAIEIAVSQRASAAVAAKVFYNGGHSSSTDRQGGSANQRRRAGMDSLANTRANFSTFDVGRPALQSIPLTRFSGAHEGAVLFLAKILYPLWGTYITSSRDPKMYQNLQPSKEAISTVREQLLAVIAFFNQYPPETMLPDLVGNNNSQSGEGTDHIANGGGRFPDHGMHPDAHLNDMNRAHISNGYTQQPQNSEARRVECSAISALKDLAVRTAEALSLLLVVSEHQLHRLAVSMSTLNLDRLVETRLCDLVVDEKGSNVSSALIKAVFDVYPDRALAVNSVGHMLRERCPSFFGDNDIDLHKGLVLLRSAADSIPENDYDQTENGWGASNVNLYGNGMAGFDEDLESLKIAAQTKAEDAASILKLVPDKVFDIHSMCNEFTKIGAIPSLIDVALTIGKKAEADNRPERAKNGYDCVIRALDPLLRESDQDNYDSLGSGSSTALREASLHVAFKSKSDVFLRSLYDFLRSSKRGEEILLQNSSPNLENYLKEIASRNLLWRYYAQHGMYVDAASILLNMAEVEENALVDRVNHLSCALHNASTAVSKGDPHAATILKEISNFMDVAKVQLRIRDELMKERQSEVDVDSALKELDTEILPLTTLFNKYARPFKLHEACLDALRCGSYRDDGYVRALWTEIIDREANANGAPAVLAHRIESLGREFYPSDVVFPTVFIIDLLERFVFKNKDSAVWRDKDDWVCNAMSGIGVPMPDIVDGYRKIVENPHGPATDGMWSWSEERAQLHLLQVAEVVINKWVSELNSVSAVGRPLMSEGDRATRAVQICKSRLRSMSFDGSSGLWSRFEELEKRITSFGQ